MAVISRHYVAERASFAGLGSVLLYVGMAIVAIAIGVPAAIATVG
jgi:hypothetical protein